MRPYFVVAGIIVFSVLGAIVIGLRFEVAYTERCAAAGGVVVVTTRSLLCVAPGTMKLPPG